MLLTFFGIIDIHGRELGAGPTSESDTNDGIIGNFMQGSGISLLENQGHGVSLYTAKHIRSLSSDHVQGFGACLSDGQGTGGSLHNITSNSQSRDLEYPLRMKKELERPCIPPGVGSGTDLMHPMGSTTLMT